MGKEVESQSRKPEPLFPRISGLWRLFWFAIALLLLVFGAEAQETLKLGGMMYTWKVEGEQLQVKVTAPDEGWIAVGFNDRNAILHADLYMLRVKNGKVEGRDLWVKAMGDPRLDTELGGRNDLQDLQGRELNGVTTVSFSIPLRSTDQYDFALTPGKPLWLILAYSMSDDWDHHSRVRKHVEWVP